MASLSAGLHIAVDLSPYGDPPAASALARPTGGPRPDLRLDARVPTWEWSTPAGDDAVSLERR